MDKQKLCLESPRGERFVKEKEKERSTRWRFLVLKRLVDLRRYCLPCLPKRHLVTMFLCSGLLLGLTMRVNLSIAMVAMVTNTSRTIVVNGSIDAETVAAEFQWSSKDQGFVLGAFFYAHTFATIPSGYLASKYGGHKSFVYGNLFVALLSLIIPTAARLHVYALFTVRLIQGPLQALLTTTFPAILSLWTPPNERSRTVAIVLTGFTGGIVLGTSISGVIAENVGWPSVFYIFGGVSLFWCLLYFWLVSPSPEKDPHISKEELEYIQKMFAEQGEEDRHSKAKTIPWKNILTSRPFLAICIIFICHSWGVFTLINGLPLYLKNVLLFDVEESGVLTSLPFIAQLIMGPLTGKIADVLLVRKIFGKTHIRKFCCCFGFSVEALFFLVAAYVSSWKLIVGGLLLAFFLGGTASNPIAVNHIDIAPRFSSFLLGILNALSCLIGIICPLVTGLITPTQSSSEWRTVFIVTGAFYIVGIVMYSVLGSAEKQPWAEDIKAIDADVREIFLHGCDDQMPRANV